MKVLHISPSYKPAYCYGGPTISVSNLCEAQVRAGLNIFVITTTANGRTELNVPINTFLDVDGVKVMYFERNTGDHTHVSFSLWLYLFKHAKLYDIIHVHSWWNFLVMVSVFICFIRGKRPFLSPRGMLSNYSFSKKNSLKKRFLHFFIGRFLLKRTFLHATTDLEYFDCKNIISDWKGFIAFNIIDLKSSIDKNLFVKKNAIFTIGTISRIDPVKGIELLIHSCKLLPFEFNLIIAGSGDIEYLNYLKKIVYNLELEDKISFVGWKEGNDKISFLENLDLLIVPSFTENFSNVVVESLSLGTPVVLSEFVGLKNFVIDNNLGWTFNLNLNSISNVIEMAYLDDEKRKNIRKEAPDFLNSFLSEKALVSQYVKSYSTF